MKFHAYIPDADNWLENNQFRKIHLYPADTIGAEHAPETWLRLGEVDVPIEVKMQDLYDQALANLDRQETEARVELERNLERIKDQRQRILAIPYEK